MERSLGTYPRDDSSFGEWPGHPAGARRLVARPRDHQQHASGRPAWRYGESVHLLCLIRDGAADRDGIEHNLRRGGAEGSIGMHAECVVDGRKRQAQ